MGEKGARRRGGNIRGEGEDVGRRGGRGMTKKHKGGVGS